jgi:hypothetical protein
MDAYEVHGLILLIKYKIIFNSNKLFSKFIIIMFNVVEIKNLNLHELLEHLVNKKAILDHSRNKIIKFLKRIKNSKKKVTLPTTLKK